MRLDHANLRVADPAACVQFYSALGLGLRGCLRLEGLYNLYLGAPGDACTLELTVKEDPDPAWEIEAGSGHVAFVVPDLDGLLATLADRGIDPEGPPYDPGGRDPLRICFLRDPEGNRVELIDTAFPTPQDPLPAGLDAR